MLSFKNYTNYTQPEDIKRLKFIQDAVESIGVKPLNIIEVGCGNGNIAFQLAKIGHQVLGIDIDETSICNAKKQFSLPNIEYQTIAVEDMQINSLWDVVVCSEVLEHLYQPLPVLKNLERLIKNDGLLILTVPNGKGPRERIITKPVQAMKKKNHFIWRLIVLLKRVLGYKGITVQSDYHSLEHVNFFSFTQILQMTSHCGLQLVSIKSANFLEKVFPFSIITRFIKPLQQFDCWLADQLPVTWASGFNMVFKKR